MRNEIKRGMLVGGAGIGLLAFALAAAPAGAADTPLPPSTSTTMQGGSTPSETQTIHATVVVTAIDKSARKLTIKTSDGDLVNITVPADVQGFDKVKKGDKIDIDYMESIAVGMAPKGTKPNAMERTATAPAAAGREVVVTAEVVKVDAAHNKVTLKGPSGKQTVSVTEPDLQARLPNLKKGQVLMFTYTEAVASAIQTK
jgi:Cu/Ag efflux protein CusF